MGRGTVAIRLDEDTLRELDAVAEQQATSRQQTARKLLKEALRRAAVEHAAEMYARREATLARSAELAHLSIWDMIAFLRERGIPAQREVREMRADIAAMLRRTGHPELVEHLVPDTDY